MFYKFPRFISFITFSWGTLKLDNGKRKKLQINIVIKYSVLVIFILILKKYTVLDKN